ncbi:MAG: HepT-like ribonuclease domain-containing protein [Pirellulaceae bacterium]|nr:HepT-like ribonuclease domain-containing protein [Pirellulaceae bacterium]
MPHDPRKLLDDIQQAVVRLQAFTSGVSQDNYLRSELLQSAVERQFEIAAEALNRLLKLAPHLAQRVTEYRRIIDFRNLLSHGYDLIDPTIVWGVLEKDVPVLRREIEQLLRELDDPASLKSENP